MARVCELTGLSVQSGNNVSHSHRKTRRRFLPNLQNISFLSEKLGMKIRLRVSTNALKTVEAKGGIDNYLLKVSSEKLSSKALNVKKILLNSHSE